MRYAPHLIFLAIIFLAGVCTSNTVKQYLTFLPTF
jgi:hypothetical protein